jgi:hypothetical protein
VKLTLWNDPKDCGLRIEVGHYRSPRDAHESNRSLFPRVSEHTANSLAEEIGDMMPEHPGEVSHVEIVRAAGELVAVGLPGTDRDA